MHFGERILACMNTKVHITRFVPGSIEKRRMPKHARQFFTDCATLFFCRQYRLLLMKSKIKKV